MKNFVNIRVQAYNNSRVVNLIKHDLRYNKNSLSQMNNNTNYIACLAHEGAIESKELNKSIYEDLKEDFKNDKAKHNELYKARTRGNLRDYHSTWASGVITFSEKLKHSLAQNEFSLMELKKVAIKCLNEFASVYKCDLKYVALHMDETTPHFHFSFSNFNKSGHSIVNSELKTTKQLRSLQDLAYKHFKELGMERGIYKEITKKRYQTPAQYWSKMEQEAKIAYTSVLNALEDKERELLTIDSEIEKKIKSKARYERQIIILKERREQIKKSDEYTEEAKKQIYKGITQEQKQAREEIKSLTQEIKGLRSDKTTIESSKKKLRAKIVSDTKGIIKNSTKSFLGVETIDQKTLAKNIYKYLSQYSNLDFSIREIEEVNSHLEEAHLKNDSLTKSLNDEIQAKNSLADTLDKTKKSNSNLESKNQEQERDLKALSNVLLGDSDDIQNANAIKIARKYYQDLDIRTKQLNKENDNIDYEDITR